MTRLPTAWDLAAMIPVAGSAYAYGYGYATLGELPAFLPGGIYR